MEHLAIASIEAPITTAHTIHTPLKSELDALHHSHWYDAYFYAPARLNPTVEFIDRLSSGKKDLTFVELFAHTGVISRAALERLPQFGQAILYELDEDTIARGVTHAMLAGLDMRYIQQDLGQKMNVAVPEHAVLYIGEESHELLHTRRQMMNLAANCKQMTRKGSKLVFNFYPLKDRYRNIGKSGDGEPQDWMELGLGHDGQPVTACYFVEGFDPLHNLIRYRYLFHSGSERHSFSFTMRYWTLSELSEIFQGFSFAVYLQDGSVYKTWHPDLYDQFFYFVGTRK